MRRIKRKKVTYYSPTTTKKEVVIFFNQYFKKKKETTNFYTLEPIRLKEGEVLCNKCNGRGILTTITKKTLRSNVPPVCKKCSGDGKLDWVENMMGGKL